MKYTATVCCFEYANLLPNTSACLIRDFRKHLEWVSVSMSGDALIDRSRSRVASGFLQAEEKDSGDVLVMIDHDISWQEGDLEPFIDRCRETKGIVGGVYSKRVMGGGIPVVFDEEGAFTTGDDQMVKAIFVSTGFFAIHREALRKIADSQEKLPIGEFWPLFIPVVYKGQELSEDWAICGRAHNLGIPVHAYMKPRLGHTGHYEYRVVDSQFPIRPTMDVTFHVYPRLESPALATLRKDISEFCQISPDEVDAAVMTARKGLAELWYAHGGHEREDEWYRREDVGHHYVLDLAGWHVQGVAHIWQEQLKDVHDLRVLDYGSGIGTVALMLAGQNCTVDIVEPNEEMKKFMKYRAEKLGLNGQVKDYGTSWCPLTEVYDLAVCWHVLEHVAEVAEVVTQVADSLKPGGRLLTQSDFHDDELHPMHYAGVNPEDLWEKAGLLATASPLWWEKPVL